MLKVRALGGLARESAVASPMLEQYLSIKAAHADELLFYRMGDFYELFFGDAVTAAEALDIVLTKRGQHNGEDIPMCGVPVHAHEQYLQRLIRAGFRVAICEQVEEPAEAKKRGSKAIVRREVERIVTAGTLTEDGLLDARSNNYLAGLGLAGGCIALAWLDVSTGEFSVMQLAIEQLASELARLDPAEVLVAETVIQRTDVLALLEDYKSVLTMLPPTSSLTGDGGERALRRVYGVATLDSFGAFSLPELAAAGGVVDYIERTQKGHLPRLSPLRHIEQGAVMGIDAATRRNLELVSSLGGGRGGSLLATIDRTHTSAGARLLAARLSAPLTDIVAINTRLDQLAYLEQEVVLRSSIREQLKRCPDIERALVRCTVGRGGPRDVAAIRDGLACADRISGLLAGIKVLPSSVSVMDRSLGCHRQILEKLAQALASELPHLARNGGFVAAGYHASLDDARTLRDKSRRLISELQSKYSKSTEIPKLKIKHNNVLGYFVEVTASHADQLLCDDRFHHRQTMANAVRFSTDDLMDLECAIREAADTALNLELKIFDELIREIELLASAIGAAANELAALDVAAALAELAADQGHVRPIVDNSLSFEVMGGRHPVVEAALKVAGSTPFVPNDCDLGSAYRLWLLTGPNMAGKSTFLRQNALIAVMAQAGAFVPATSAHIGIVDQLFSRVGAADDLARGRSTFMVEMVETAAILNQAGPRALVILDEIGRGTATFDGLSIAWAVIEQLHEINHCRALFATHYRELTVLAGCLDGLANFTVTVKEWRGDVVFLHAVTPGAAEASYGIQVARLAGLPDAVIKRAEEVLYSLEFEDSSSAALRLAHELPLFSAEPRESPAVPPKSEVELLLADVRPDEISPREALDLLYRLRAAAARE